MLLLCLIVSLTNLRAHSLQSRKTLVPIRNNAKNKGGLLFTDLNLPATGIDLSLNLGLNSSSFSSNINGETMFPAHQEPSVFNSGRVACLRPIRAPFVSGLCAALLGIFFIFLFFYFAEIYSRMEKLQI
uniref:Legume lectin domain-containing protein n=1 Tax=Setaria viridis TaxID=4556 RepID=A0A4U6WNQ9_SETVI|nr:hypothetical protein SEVIR_1G237410v2 [Setaria viridis]